MFDGAVAVTVADAIHPDVPQSTTVIDKTSVTQTVDHSPAPAAVASNTSEATSNAAPNGEARVNVVFIDANVADYSTLIAGLPAGTTAVLLNPDTDGFAQIAEYLQSHANVAAIHLISHGTDGQIQAGSAVLDTADLSQYSAELTQIGAAMAPGGDFLIYGCDVAGNADGQALVQQIAGLTHLNVAASTDNTGAAALGGNWTLEYDVGDVYHSGHFVCGVGAGVQPSARTDCREL